MISILKKLHERIFLSAEQYARRKGVKIGKNCFIATRNWGSEPYLISIGNRVAITAGTRFFTHGGARVARQKYPKFDIFGKIKVEDGAYIGACSMIMAGVTIGEGALVAAGSVVTKSVAPRTVVGGNPARYICTVDEYIERNKKYNLNTKGLSADEKRKFLLSLSDDRFIIK